jgi:hypothetical protein
LSASAATQPLLGCMGYGRSPSASSDADEYNRDGVYSGFADRFEREPATARLRLMADTTPRRHSPRRRRAAGERGADYVRVLQGPGAIGSGDLLDRSIEGRRFRSSTTAWPVAAATLRAARGLIERRKGGAHA